jgi:hypothetical protein
MILQSIMWKILKPWVIYKQISWPQEEIDILRAKEPNQFRKRINCRFKIKKTKKKTKNTANRRSIRSDHGCGQLIFLGRLIGPPMATSHWFITRNNKSSATIGVDFCTESSFEVDCWSNVLLLHCDFWNIIFVLLKKKHYGFSKDVLSVRKFLLPTKKIYMQNYLKHGISIKTGSGNGRSRSGYHSSWVSTLFCLCNIETANIQPHLPTVYIVLPWGTLRSQKTWREMLCANKYPMLRTWSLPLWTDTALKKKLHEHHGLNTHILQV